MTVTNYVWDPVSDNVLAETDDLGATQVAYTHEPDEFGKLVSERRSGTTRYHHFDALGSTTELTDANESVTDTFRYTAFGELEVHTGTTPTPFRWLGEIGYHFDEETGDYWIRIRPFQPKTGRWSSPDPAGFVDEPNRYVYVRNDAVNLGDPSGMVPGDCCCCCVEAVQFGPTGNAARFEGEIPFDPNDPNTTIPTWGHRFTHVAHLLRIRGGKGKCEFEWFECSSNQTGLMRRRGIPAGKWFDAHDTLKDVSGTSSNWKDYEDDKPLYDKLGCPTRFKIEARDTPVMPFRQARTLKFAIKVTSAEDCPCTLSDLVVFATQILMPAGRDALGNRVEEVWELKMGLDPSPPNCGPVPFKKPPKGLNDPLV